jgi:hypothetical protein
LIFKNKISRKQPKSKKSKDRNRSSKILNQKLCKSHSFKIQGIRNCKDTRALKIQIIKLQKIKIKS